MLFWTTVSLVSIFAAAAAGYFLGGALAGVTPPPASTIEPDSDASLKAAIYDCRSRAADIWGSRAKCEAKVGALFLAGSLSAIALVVASMRTIGTGSAVFVVLAVMLNAVAWGAYLRARACSEEKRLAGIAADAVVERLERIENERVD